MAFICERLWSIDKIKPHEFNWVLPCRVRSWLKQTQDNVYLSPQCRRRNTEWTKANVKDAYYKLVRPESQIKSYIEDALRSSVPKLTLMNCLRKDECPWSSKNKWQKKSTYGYIIVKNLITKVEPDAEVKQSMNEINAAQRKRVAELAEADKTDRYCRSEVEKDRRIGVVLLSNGRLLSMDWQTLLKS